MKVLLVMVVLLVGCDKEIVITDPSVFDQCLRREVFMQCLATVPKGPERVSDSNDWDEVIDECATAAQYMSVRRLSKIKEECRP